MKKIEINDILDYNYLSALKLHADKKRFSYVVSKADIEGNKYKQTLYLSDGKKHRELYHFTQGSEYHFYDEETILILETVDKCQFIYFVDINTKELLRKIKVDYKISGLRIIDENRIIFTSYHNPQKETYDEDLFEIIETIPFQSNGSGFTQGKFNQLFLLNVENESITALSLESENVNSYELSPDKNNLFYSSTENTGILNFYPTLYALDLSTLDKTTLYSKETLSIGTIIPLKNELYVTASSLKEHGINQNNDFYKVEGNDLHLVAEFSLSAYNSIGSDVRYGSGKSSHIRNNKYYFVGTYHKSNRLYEFDGNKITVLYTSKGSIDCWDFIDDKNIIAVSLQSNRLQEVYQLNIESKQYKMLTDINAKHLKDKYISVPQYISFENDGQKLDGWVLLPQNYDTNKKYPAILDIHGGPKTIFSDVFYHEMQVWANQGYIVFFANPRGGDVYGNDFADIRGKYGTIDYDDLMKFTDIVIDKFSVDTSRIGVTGGSYGGFMTNWIVGHTNRFKAAATQRSISNWISFYGTSDIGYYFASDQTDANPYTKLEAMWEQSPLKHARDIKTPLLFIHSDQDYRCPIEQAMQLYTVVKEQGVDTRFVWFKGENHDLSRSGRPKGRIKRLEEITDWMNNHLK